MLKDYITFVSGLSVGAAFFMFWGPTLYKKTEIILAIALGLLWISVPILMISGVK